MMIDEIQHIII